MKKPLTLACEGLCFSAVWTGLEPATPCVTGRYSNQLNYQTKFPTLRYQQQLVLRKLSALLVKSVGKYKLLFVFGKQKIQI